MYLIMECDELNDQWECDARRSPVTLTENWCEWYEATNPTYSFEVYEFVKNSFHLVKSYDTPIDAGMIFTYYDKKSKKPIVIKKFPNLTRDDEIPTEILKRAENGKQYVNRLFGSGCITWVENNVSYYYTEYADNDIYLPF